jgi:hypothetical protein
MDIYKVKDSTYNRSSREAVEINEEGQYYPSPSSPQYKNWVRESTYKLSRYHTMKR